MGGGASWKVCDTFLIPLYPFVILIYQMAN